MQQYLNMLQFILDNGEQRSNRTGIDAISVFGYQNRFNLKQGFPVITTKKLFFKGVVHELLWILKGDTNNKYLTDNNVHIWDEWASTDGSLGKIYGKQMRSFGDKVDQLKDAIKLIKNDPKSRRHIITLWNPLDLEDQALACCHGTVIQFNVNNNNELSCHMYQRSADAFLGVPFNIASYSLLTHMIAKTCNLQVNEFVHSFGDLHIYNNHIKQVKEQLIRIPYDLPQLWLNPDIQNIEDYKYEDIKLTNYNSHSALKGEVAI